MVKLFYFIVLWWNFNSCVHKIARFTINKISLKSW